MENPSSSSSSSSPSGFFFPASDLDLDYTLLSCGPVEEARDDDDDGDNNDNIEEDNGRRDDEFLDLDELSFLTAGGVDRYGRKILRVVGKFFPAPVIDCVRLKEYVVHTVQKEFKEEEAFSIVYIHTCVKRNDNSPGVLNIRWIYEAIPQDFRKRIAVVYFVHPGLISWIVMGMLGRFFLSDGLYWKVNYISRIEFLWDHIKKEQIEIPEFVLEHDAELEHRPLIDYGIDSDPQHMYGLPSHEFSHSRQAARWVP